MISQKFRKRLQLAIYFLIFATLAFVLGNERILDYVVLNNLPIRNITKLLGLSIISNFLIISTKIGLGAILLNLYLKLKNKGIPFIGYLWIFSAYFFMMSLVFIMGLINIWRVYYWIDGIIRIVSGIFGVASLIAFWAGAKYMSNMKSPTEYKILADELERLRGIQENVEKVSYKDIKDPESGAN